MGMKVLPALMLLIACGNGGVAGQNTKKEGNDTGNVADADPPVIVFEPFSDAQPADVDMAFSATITDASALLVVELHYRQETSGSKDWSTLAFRPGDGENEWTSKIPAEELRSAGLYYYLEAVDTSQNDAVLPSGSTTSYHVRLSG